jgi:hypothetical protein
MSTLPLSGLHHQPPDADLPYLEALYRGRVECRICDAKDTSLANLHSHDFTINTAWLTLVLIAADLPQRSALQG